MCYSGSLAVSAFFIKFANIFELIFAADESGVKVYEEIGPQKTKGPFRHNQTELVDKDEYDKLFTIQNIEPHLKTSDSLPDTLDEPIMYDCACDYVRRNPEDIIHCFGC